jgi:hypothetical protein
LNRILPLCLMATLSLSGHSETFGEEVGSSESDAISLQNLAASADVIALAQVRDTDYFYRRDFPVEGSAYLQALIVYKTNKPLDIIEVFEQGLHQNECYFPNPDVVEEGQRYLLFLQVDDELPDRYRGLSHGCALDVLVARDNSYALRLPVTGAKLSDPLSGSAKTIDYSDPYALENTESLGSDEINGLLKSGLIKPHEDGFQYTKGVDLGEIRKLMGEAGLSEDRRLRRIN